MRRRKLLIAVLALGTLLGYGSCAARAVHGCRTYGGPFAARHQRFENHVADLCVEAVERARRKGEPAAAPR